MPRVSLEILRGWSHSFLPNPEPSQLSHPSNTINVIPDAFLYLGSIPLDENMAQVEVEKYIWWKITVISARHFYCPITFLSYEQKFSEKD